MRVSYFYDLALPSRFAAPIQILHTCHELAALGVRTTVYVGPIEGNDTGRVLAFYGLPSHPNLDVVPLFSPFWRGLDLRWRLPSILAPHGGSGEPHVLISRGETGVALLPLLRRLGRDPATRLVYEAHRLVFAHEAERVSGRRWRPGDALPRRVERLRRREHMALGVADGLLCLTEGVRRAVEAAFDPAAASLVLPSGAVLPDEATPPDPGTARDIDLLYVGKLEPRKGVPLLIEAMRHLPGRRLWIVGGDPSEVGVLETLAREAGVADRIVCTGFVEPSRVGAFLRRARVGLCPLAAGVSVTTDEFTSPLKALELMAHGVPLVASDLPSVRELAEHDRTAVLVRPDDPRALAEGVRSLLADPARAAGLARAARARAAGFSWRSRALRLRRFLAGLADPPAASRPAPVDTPDTTP